MTVSRKWKRRLEKEWNEQEEEMLLVFFCSNLCIYCSYETLEWFIFIIIVVLLFLFPSNGFKLNTLVKNLLVNHNNFRNLLLSFYIRIFLNKIILGHSWMFSIRRKKNSILYLSTNFLFESSTFSLFPKASVNKRAKIVTPLLQE